VINSKRVTVFACVLAVATLSAAGLSAQATKAATGTEFYKAYIDAFGKAKSIDEVAKWLAKEQREKIAASPKDEQKMMFGMIKEMSADHTDIKVLKETPTANGAELDVEAMSKMSKGKVKAKIMLVKENGEWKVSKENWQG
jgi:hypothetical protein